METSRPVPKINWAKNYAMLLIPIGVFYVGRYMEWVETNRMDKFRDKSKLYGRELKPGEPPSWPKPNYPLFH